MVNNKEWRRKRAMERFKNKLLKRATSLVVVVALFIVGVIGEHYINGKIEPYTKVTNGENKVVTAEGMFAAYSKNQKLKSEDEIKLATTDTKIGKVGEKLRVSYEKLLNSYVGKSNQFNKAAVEFNRTVAELKREADDITADGSAEAGDDEFRNYIAKNFDVLEKYASQLASSDDVDKTMKKIGKLIVPEEEQAVLSSDTSFDDITNEEIDTAKKINPEETTGDNNVESENNSINAQKVTNADISLTNDTAINDKIKSEVEEYKSVLDIYQYIKNNYQMEFYYGSRKGQWELMNRNPVMIMTSQVFL